MGQNGAARTAGKDRVHLPRHQKRRRTPPHQLDRSDERIAHEIGEIWEARWTHMAGKTYEVRCDARTDRSPEVGLTAGAAFGSIDGGKRV